MKWSRVCRGGASRMRGRFPRPSRYTPRMAISFTNFCRPLGNQRDDEYGGSFKIARD